MRKGEKKYFKTRTGKQIALPVFFPDATRGVVKALSMEDVVKTGTPGVLVNTYHLYLEAKDVMETIGVRKFMNWEGGLISDSGGFQLMSLVKRNGNGKVTDEGIVFKLSQRRKMLFTPEDSIAFQFEIGADMMVVLDDFTPPGADRKMAEETVRRTVDWAKRCKAEYSSQCEKRGIKGDERPYLLGVIQGGDFLDLREQCARELVKIGFDGLGFGGWPVDEKGKLNLEVTEKIAEETPEDYFLYGLGVGKPEDIVACVRRGYEIFDCVLPTRDARHGRLYVLKGKSWEDIAVDEEGEFYEYLVPRKGKFRLSEEKVDESCDCELCANYSRGYLHHLFRIGDVSVLRLASIHNLRFYSRLMEKLGGAEIR